MKPHPIIVRDEMLRARVLKLVMSLDLTKPWRVTVEPYKRSRSLEQNNLLWMWYGVIAQETGHDAEEIHEFCKQKFLPPVFVDIAGEVRETRRTTTKLKVDEMSAYLNAVHAWAVSELSVILPLPEEQGRHAA